MHRIDTPDSREGRFDDNVGFPGQKGSVVDDDWLNAVQEEIAGTIEGLGGNLQKGNNGQLLAVIRALRDNIINEVVPQAILNARKAENPIGCTRIFANDSRNPSTILGFGSWVATAKGRALVGVGYNGESLYSAGDRFGSEQVRLRRSELPRERLPNGVGDDGDSHVFPYGTTTQDMPGAAHDEIQSGSGGSNRQGLTDYLGSGQSHENRQPSEVFYIWKRIA